jgi:hypothetical protein
MIILKFDMENYSVNDYLISAAVKCKVNYKYISPREWICKAQNPILKYSYDLNGIQDVKAW